MANGGVWTKIYPDVASLGGGKVLQVVRAVDTDNRSTNSTASFVDAEISVTITPQKSDSAVLLIWSAYVLPDVGNVQIHLQITDDSNNAISGAEDVQFGDTVNGRIRGGQTLIGYATPATTSPTTYKGRFKSGGNVSSIPNSVSTGQLYAIELADVAVSP
jgi:hypothetical protein